MAIGDVFEAAAILVYDIPKQRNIVNVFHFTEQSGAPTPDAASDLTAVIESFYKDSILPYMSNKISLIEVRAQKVWPLPRSFPVAIFPGAQGDTGQVIDDALPPQNALLFTLFGEYAGRRYRGRKFFAGIPENAQSSGSFTNNAGLNAMTLGLRNLMTVPVFAPNGATFQGVIWSGASPDGGRIVKNVTGNYNIRTQRRRQRT